MMKLYDNGVFLLNGTEILEDTGGVQAPLWNGDYPGQQGCGERSGEQAGQGALQGGSQKADHRLWNPGGTQYI